MQSFKQEPFGFIAMILQLAVIFIGMPDELWHNYQAHSVGPLSFLFIGLPLLASVAWFLHSWRESKNNYLAIPQIPAIIFGLILVGQFLFYR